MPKSDRPAFTAEVVEPTHARAILTAFHGSRLEPLVLFSVAKGLRERERFALRWQDIDLEKRTVTIRHAVDIQDRQRVLARPKSLRAQRTLRLPEMAVQALTLRRQQEAEDRDLVRDAWEVTNLVFAGPTGGLRDGTAVTRDFKALLERQGLPVIRWHALRRVFAAIRQDQGVPLERIRDLVCHSERRVTEGYAYMMPESLERDMRAVDEALGNRRIGKPATPDAGPE